MTEWLLENNGNAPQQHPYADGSCVQAWQFRQLELLTRTVNRVEGLEARLDRASTLCVAPGTTQLCTDKLEGLAAGLDEGMASLGSVVASCSKLTTLLESVDKVARKQ